MLRRSKRASLYSQIASCRRAYGHVVCSHITHQQGIACISIVILVLRRTSQENIQAHVCTKQCSLCRFLSLVHLFIHECILWCIVQITCAEREEGCCQNTDLKYFCFHIHCLLNVIRNLLSRQTAYCETEAWSYYHNRQPEQKNRMHLLQDPHRNTL